MSQEREYQDFIGKLVRSRSSNQYTNCFPTPPFFLKANPIWSNLLLMVQLWGSIVYRIISLENISSKKYSSFYSDKMLSWRLIESQKIPHPPAHIEVRTISLDSGHLRTWIPLPIFLFGFKILLLLLSFNHDAGSLKKWEFPRILI